MVVRTGIGAQGVVAERRRALRRDSGHPPELSLIEVQRRLGHSSVSAAMRYQHAAGRDAEIADALARMMA